jgi:Arc/MetJ-type ribon-helix-helix transcriptional regulator
MLCYYNTMDKQKLDLTLFLDNEMIDWIDKKVALNEFRNRNEIVEHALRIFMKMGETHTFDREV